MAALLAIHSAKASFTKSRIVTCRILTSVKCAKHTICLVGEMAILPTMHILACTKAASDWSIRIPDPIHLVTIVS